MKNAIRNIIKLYGNNAVNKSIKVDKKDIKILHINENEVKLEISEIKYGNKTIIIKTIFL